MITAEQIEKEIKDNSKKWAEEMDRVYPGAVKDENDIAGMVTTWFTESMKKRGLKRKEAIVVYDPFVHEFATEMSRFRGCEIGRQKLAIQIAVKHWNKFATPN